MKFVILATGTRGDVQPFVALAQGLRAAGHEAVLAAPGSFESFVRSHGVGFFPMGGDYEALLESPEAQAALRGNPVKMMQVVRQTVFPMMRRMLEDAWAAAQGADACRLPPEGPGGRPPGGSGCRCLASLGRRCRRRCRRRRFLPRPSSAATWAASSTGSPTPPCGRACRPCPGDDQRVAQAGAGPGAAPRGRVRAGRPADPGAARLQPARGAPPRRLAARGDRDGLLVSQAG